jgi:hypothetical protein
VPLDLSLPAKHDIECILDLVGAAVVLPAKPDAPEDQPPPAVFSPLQDDPQAIRDQLPRLADLTTTTDQQVLYGRVNVNEAPRYVLLGIPGLEATVVDRILALRSTVADTSDLGRRHALWLFRAQIAVRRSDSGRMARAEVVVDASQSPPRQVYGKNLSLLGGSDSGGTSPDQNPDYTRGANRLPPSARDYSFGSQPGSYSRRHSCMASSSPTMWPLAASQFSVRPVR